MDALVQERIDMMPFSITTAANADESDAERAITLLNSVYSVLCDTAKRVHGNVQAVVENWTKLSEIIEQLADQAMVDSVAVRLKQLADEVIKANEFLLNSV